ncbi:MAG: rod shape-determining protein MreC [Capsulimonadaceae bacterium]|nr:rod shape-determining protein MreC [Capsulimonadaceae bacterium]
MRTSRKDRTSLAVIIIVLLGIAFTLYHKHEAHQGRVDRITTLVQRFVLMPETRAIHGLMAPGRRFAPFYPASLIRENTQLRARVAALTVENEQLREQAQQMEEMRKMLMLPDVAPSILRAGEVIALKPSSQRDNALVTLGNGWVARERDIVIGPSGALAGQVVRAGAVCDVLLITDPQSSVGAKVVQVGRPAPHKAIVGIAQGARGSSLDLVDLPADADIKVGDSVVTSGMGTVFPQDIPIGSVTSVKLDPARSLKTATIETINDFNSLRKVFLRR